MKVKTLSELALFIALSAVGAGIKIPSPVGSVALDAFPAIIAGGLLGGGAGAVVGALGHLLSALLSGFKLGPMHLLIAGEMAVLVWIFATLFKRNKKVLAAIIFIVGNAVIAPVPFIFLISKGFYLTLLPSLFAGAVINMVIAMVLLPRVAAIMIRKKQDAHQ